MKLTLKLLALVGAAILVFYIIGNGDPHNTAGMAGWTLIFIGILYLIRKEYDRGKKEEENERLRRELEARRPST